MKTAIYIEDGVVQLVVTPETEFEKNALTSFENRKLKVQIFNGSFYDCRGGWTLQNNFGHTYRPDLPHHDTFAQRSIILRIENSDDERTE